MKFIEIKRACGGWIVEYTSRQSLCPTVTVFTTLESAMSYLKEIMSND